MRVQGRGKTNNRFKDVLLLARSKRKERDDQEKTLRDVLIKISKERKGRERRRRRRKLIRSICGGQSAIQTRSIRLW